MFQEPSYLPAAMVALLAVMCLSAILYRVLKGNGATRQSKANYKPVRFAPMGRLLGHEDFEYLKTLPGYTPQIAARLRTRRVAIFKEYMRSLAVEFNELHRALRILTLHAPEDRSEIARLLVEQRMLFSVRLFQVRIRLAFYALGMKPVDVSALVETINTMREQVRRISAAMEFSPSAA